MVKEITSEDYKVRRKEWDWLEISKWAGDRDKYGAMGVNDKMCGDFIEPWIFDEVLYITWEKDSRKGMLVTFDSCKSFSSRFGDEMTRYMKAEVMKSIFMDYFGAELYIERGVEKYYFDGWDMSKLCVEWIKHIKGERTMNERDWKVYVDNDKRYTQLSDNYFTKLGFSERYYYDGVYDKKTNKIKFSAFEGRYGSRAISIGYNPAKDDKETGLDRWLTFFKASDDLFHGLYLCEFNGNKEDFESVCELLK